MTNDKNLANELLKQNGLDPQKISVQSAQRTREMLAKELRRANRIKLVSRILWLMIVILLAVTAIVTNVSEGDSARPVVGLAIVGCYVLGICAIICSIMAHVALRNTTLKQIQASLADIAEELKRQSRDS
ncbi:MAG: hypothetical protein KAT11_03545 [Phycisphaerae bacterium]|nr:hypothetical protein [Phycisphaerae bacterium]